MTQFFDPNSELEKRVFGLLAPKTDQLALDKKEFYEGAYECAVLGDVLYDLDIDPLSGKVSPEVFRMGFYAFHNLYTRPGTFEYYLDVFRAVFGDQVEIEFTIPRPGALYINVQSLDAVLDDFVARRIEDNEYFYDEVVTHDGDNIAFQVTRGIRSQSEIDALMHELSTYGIYTRAFLVV